MSVKPSDDRELPPNEHAIDHFDEGEEVAPAGVRAMAVLRWLLVLAMASAAALSILYVYGDTGHVAGGGETQYYCPMHPSVVQDHPGDCPICNMTLVSREPPAPVPKALDAGNALAGEPAPLSTPSVTGLTSIELPEQRIQLIGMRTAKATRATLPSELRAVGYIAPTESGLAVIQTRFSGWIEELHVTETGQLVQRGQLLARVYSPELLAAQQELLNARQWSSGFSGQRDAAPGSAALAGSARGRLELMGMLASEIAEVERTGTPHRLIEIRSPVRGYVAQKSAIQGLYIQPGTRLFDLADLSKVWLFVELFERDAGRIKAGQQAALSLTAYPGETFRGKVQRVYPTLNTETRTQRARIDFNNADLRLRPGMFGDVVIQQGSADALVVPREAVVDTGEQQHVFVAEGAGRFTPHVVQLGARFQDSVQILTGINEGDVVVTTGNFLLDSESRLRSAIAGSASKRAH